MADKQISSLPAATSVDDNSLFVVEQQGVAMSASGALWKGFAVDTVQPYATAASGSATAAATSATNAAASAQAAQNSADSISGSVETAQQAAQEAAQSAQQAASSASGVAESAEAAASSAQQATQASQNASSAQAAAESASEDAQAASTSAGQSATQAQSSASAAQQSATSASASATTAQQQAQAAQSSASAAATSAIAAGEAQEAIENLGVSAETLPTGSAATVTKSVVDGIVQLLFGLPAGATGAKGDPGNSIQKIERTSGNGAPGTTDTYTVYLTDGSTGGTFQVYNGSNGTGSGDFMADGSVPMTGALQMGGNKITNLGAPGADTDAVRKQDLDAVAAEVDGILDGTTPAHLAPATETKIGGVIIGEGLSVETDGTVSAESQLPAGGTTGQILTQGANGPEWADAPDTGVTTFNGRTGAVTPQEGDYTAAMVGALAAPDGGTAGQVLTKTASGEAWQNAPSGLPDGATEGQMLYQGATGPEWGDKPVMYVNITGDDSSGYVADKTASEIYEAYSNGNAIFAINKSIIIGLHDVSVSDGVYNAVFLKTYDTTYIVAAVIEASGSGSFVDVESKPISLNAVNVDFTPASTLTSDNVQDAIEEVQGHIDAAKPVLRTATLTTSGWSGNTQTVTVNGIIADSASQSVDVVPADHNSAKAWGDAGVWCDSQGANTLTFSCESVPTANITLNIRFQEART